MSAAEQHSQQREEEIGGLYSAMRDTALKRLAWVGKHIAMSSVHFAWSQWSLFMKDASKEAYGRRVAEVSRMGRRPHFCMSQPSPNTHRGPGTRC